MRSADTSKTPESLNGVFNPKNDKDACSGAYGSIAKKILVESTDIRTFQSSTKIPKASDPSSPNFIGGLSVAIFPATEKCNLNPKSKPLLTGVLGRDSESAEYGNKAGEVAKFAKSFATMRPYFGSKSNITGSVNVNMQSGKAMMIYNLKGLKPSTIYHTHIMEYGDFGNMNMGGNFNPTNKQHGCLMSDKTAERMVGDLGNFKSDEKGNANFQLENDLIALEPSLKNSVLGRSIVIKQGADSCKPDSASAPIVAAGVLGKVDTSSNSGTLRLASSLAFTSLAFSVILLFV
jgi:Cu/Zn superoxide dismutase